MNELDLRRFPPDQSSGSLRTIGTLRHASVTNPIPSKRVCFYKSGDPQFSGLRMVVNNRTFKTFDALLDSLSKKVPLPFGVRNITTPRGVHAINTLDELEDGKSYICSDSRKVKPINLALARKKLAPWYHARPASSRRRTLQRPRAFPGRQEPVLVHTPKRLVVFRNGDPSVKHKVVIQKRSSTTFEWILEYISEMMQFHVVKLHTADGRRVEGLPSLILCSGVVVAAGKETFRPANYNTQKSPGSRRPSDNQMSVGRLKALNRKKKSQSYGSKSRKFSTSSERYIVNKIQNSLMESSCDLPSHPSNSLEYESGVVAETEGGEQDCMLPDEDDIEKSFRVNQDGSMTVEMRVRLTVKEEETLHWTTTLTRSSVDNHLNNMACLPEPESEQDVCATTPDSQDPISFNDTINKNESKDDHDEGPPSLGNGVLSQSSNEEEAVKIQATSPRRAPTPGHKQIRNKQASRESIRSIGSYSYSEETENGALTEQYCMVKQSSARPIPKPRRLSSMDNNSMSNTNGSSYKSAEIMHMESSGEEITETVLHIYEQQTCQDNYNANVGSFYRPANSEKGHLRTNDEFEHEPWGPSTASESVSIWKDGNKPVTADLHSPKHSRVKMRQRVAKPTIGKENQPRPKSRRIPKVSNKGIRRLLSPGKRQRENVSVNVKKRKKVTPFSSAGFIRRIYGNKFKPSKSPTKLKRRMTKSTVGSAVAKSTKLPDKMQQNTLQNPNVSEAQGELTRQTSVNRDKHHDVSEQMSLPAFDSSSSVANEYVQNWLKKSHINQPADCQRKTDRIENQGLIPAADGENIRELTTQTSPEDVRGTSVRYRILSLENKMAPSNHQINREGINAHPKTNKETPPASETENQAKLQERFHVLSTDLALPTPPEEKMLEKSNPEYHVACNPRCVQPAGSSQTSDNHPPSAQALPHAQHVMRMTQLLEAEVPKEEETLSRSMSIKRAPLVSNVSLERKMSLRKSCMDKFTVCNNEEKEQSLLDPKGSSSMSPKSLISEEQLSSVSMPSSEVPTSPNIPLPSTKVVSSPKTIASPKSQSKNLASELPKRSQSLQRHPADKKMSPNVSPLPKKRQTLSKSEQSKQNTHSQSMDLASPPVRRKSKGKMLSRNFSSDSESADIIRKTPSQRKQLNSLQAIKEPVCTDETANQTDELQKQDQEKSMTDTKVQAQPSNIVNQANMQPVFENVCYSIKSIRQITQVKRPSCLEKFNRVPDFSSHVASTFGSSSKVLLAFLSIVALKDSIAILNVDQLRANDVSCAEALRMIDSLREIASMEDARRLEDNVSALQESASRQLLDSWRGFQELGDTHQEEQAIDDIIEGLDIPNALKEELMSLSAGSVSASPKKLKADSEGCSYGMEEHNELAHDDEAQQKMNSYHVLHSTEVQSSEEECEDKPQGEDCYVELNPSRKESPEKHQPETEGKMQRLDKAQPEVEDKGLNRIAEESQSGPDKEENEEEIRNEMQDILGDERLTCDSNPERGNPQDPAIDDSGNDQSCCDDHTESSVLEYEQIRSSTEEELSFYEKASRSEEEHGYLTECQAAVTDMKCDKVAVAKDLSDEETSQPVAVRVSLLEKQVADAQKTRYNKHVKNVSLVSEDSMETFQQCSLSAPQSSLSFSYDCSGVVTVEPEGNRVKSIREMFLAKSSADNAKQSLKTESPSDMSVGGGYQSRMSSEQSSSEEDPVRKSISKGFVRRTIERLYGKSNAVERLPLAPGTKKKHCNIFSPFHTARCKAASELSYFNSTNALDTLTEATRCIAFNAQVGPRDSVPIDEGRWLIRDNALIRKSISDPTGINKNLVNSAQDEDNCEDTQEDSPYSLFSTTSEPEDHKKSKRCTYFSLPHTSDSEVCQDEPSVLEAKLESAAQTRPERNGSAVGMPDNKVHPLVELPVDGEVVVVVAQPKKGHGVVSQSLQEPDVLDLLYNFCGENCPIL
ncbi:oxygen-regulated protein 1-like [Phyllopteryx taeniolatus]|uniref:oxygen-regulated protein 1-like n=1 Tax=Phyllopteryx taeniolatus TaxID=161469 RepID=UPI002AD5268C|nr:oxygen-regulated protein 1-like [Phyllopteryx taeniolatus]